MCNRRRTNHVVAFLLHMSWVWTTPHPYDSECTREVVSVLCALKSLFSGIRWVVTAPQYGIGTSWVTPTAPSGTERHIGITCFVPLGSTVAVLSSNFDLPSRELTYPTWGNGKSPSKVPNGRGYGTVPKRVLVLPIPSPGFRWRGTGRREDRSQAERTRRFPKRVVFLEIILVWLNLEFKMQNHPVEQLWYRPAVDEHQHVLFGQIEFLPVWILHKKWCKAAEPEVSVEVQAKLGYSYP